MVRVLLILTFLFSFLSAKDMYEKNCISCHKKLPVSIDKYFYRYLLKYSSERNVKSKMFDFLKTPNKNKSVMSKSFILRFGIKDKTKLNDKELMDALDRYWKKYKVVGKLK